MAAAPLLLLLQGVTKVRFCTDGVLLREMMEDPLLMRWGRWWEVVGGELSERHERALRFGTATASPPPTHLPPLSVVLPRVPHRTAGTAW